MGRSTNTMTIQIWQFIAATVGAWAGLAGAFGVGFTVGRSRGKEEAYADMRASLTARKKRKGK